MESVIERRQVFGVGYEGLGIDAFTSVLRTSDVRLLVDVRLNPISRKRGFSKRLLSGSLAEAGIGYLHFPELGNPKWNRAGFSGSTLEVHRARMLYEAMMTSDGAQARLGEITDAVREGTVALMCFEADAEACHRYVILRELRRRMDLCGVEV
jgi:uncharacterized protein (DUF488 family)